MLCTRVQALLEAVRVGVVCRCNQRAGERSRRRRKRTRNFVLDLVRSRARVRLRHFKNILSIFLTFLQTVESIQTTSHFFPPSIERLSCTACNRWLIAEHQGLSFAVGSRVVGARS